MLSGNAARLGDDVVEMTPALRPPGSRSTGKVAENETY